MTSAPPFAASLRIVIVGGGTGGMSTALALAAQGIPSTVYETASKMGEVGAGINLCPNLARILDRFGVLEEAASEAVALDGAIIIRSKTDEVLSSVDFASIEKSYKYPFYTVHRAALQRAIISGCERSGLVKVELGQTLVDVDFDATRIRIRPSKDTESEGAWIEADVVLAADGVKSFARGAMLARHGEVESVVDTGQAAYRILLTREQMGDDEELLKLIDGQISHRWIGHQRHIIAYPIANNTIWNMSTAHPDSHFSAGPSTAWTTRGSQAEMLDTYKDFCPRVQKLLNLVQADEVCEWKLRVHHPLKTWIEGSFALVGDSCHPTLPHLAQGAAQAVEDAGVLGIVLSKLKDRSGINRALRVYELARKDRAEKCVAAAAENGRKLHVPDGAEQEKRDAAFKNSKDGAANPDLAVDTTTQEGLYGFDCVKDVEDRWEELWEKVGESVVA